MFDTNNVKYKKNKMYITWIIIFLIIAFFQGYKIFVQQRNNLCNKRIMEKDIFTKEQEVAVLKYFHLNTSEDLKLVFAKYTHGQDPAFTVWISGGTNIEKVIEDNLYYKKISESKSVYDYATGQYYSGNVYSNEDFDKQLSSYKKGDIYMMHFVSYKNLDEIIYTVFSSE